MRVSEALPLDARGVQNGNVPIANTSRRLVISLWPNIDISVVPFYVGPSSSDRALHEKLSTPPLPHGCVPIPLFEFQWCRFVYSQLNEKS